jgi:argininosuccinate lyase
MLWGSRFSKELNQSALEFSTSIKFDINLFYFDIKVSKAHANMLQSIGILTKEELEKIINGLNTIEKKFTNKEWNPGNKIYEDIHSAIEDELTKQIGNVAKKLHTGRSRNDQVITDMRLWTKNSISILLKQFIKLQKSLLNLANENIKTLMPGYTHLQRAQPISLAFHLLAYVEKIERDKARLAFTLNETDVSILGSGALAGSTIELDRKQVAKELSFSKISNNALDGVSDRDFSLDFLNACNIAMMHLSRLSEELIVWSTYEWKYIQLGDDYTTGSSLMPQKKNPDIPEIVRGKTGRVYGNYFALLTIMKSLPLSYNRDMQEDKEGVFDSFQTLSNSLTMMSAIIDSIKVNKTRFVDEIDGSFMLATDLADYLVLKGIPFREAHNIIGEVVKFATEQNKKLNQITVEEYKTFNSVFDADVYNYLSAKTCLENKKTIGSPNPTMVEKQINQWYENLNS